jgi:hypothetical protein
VIAVVAELFVVVNTIVLLVILAHIFRIRDAVNRQWENIGYDSLIIGIHAMSYPSIRFDRLGTVSIGRARS